MIYSSKSAYLFLRNRFRYDVEEFWVLALSANKRVLAADCLFRGTVDSCMIHPRDIFRFACLHNASSLILSHNHPSEDLTPSAKDLEITSRLVGLGELMQIDIVDHLILVSNGYSSFVDMALPPFS